MLPVRHALKVQCKGDRLGQTRLTRIAKEFASLEKSKTAKHGEMFGMRVPFRLALDAVNKSSIAVSKCEVNQN